MKLTPPKAAAARLTDWGVVRGGRRHHRKERVVTDRPHRHLCPKADQRDAMTDEEFWAHVCPDDDDRYIDPEPDLDDDVQLSASACPKCGEVGACAYDAEGRALIHALRDEDDE